MFQPPRCPHAGYPRHADPGTGPVYPPGSPAAQGWENKARLTMAFSNAGK